MHHLILGGCGFIGRHVAVMLARDGARVTVADRSPPPETLRRYAEIVPVELATADWDTLLADVDVVHHYAWSSIPGSANANPAGDLSLNLGTTLALLEALRRRDGGRIVFASSGGTVYGRAAAMPLREDTPLAPISAYGASKATAEMYLGLYRALHKLDCRVARIANPYGAGQDPKRGLGAVTTFLHNAMTGAPIEIWGTGDVVRDYIHVSDVARCLVMLSTAPLAQGPLTFNVGTGIGTSLNGIVAALRTQLGRDVLVVRKGERAFDVPANILAIERVGAALGWHPAIALPDGITRTIHDVRRGADLATLDP